MIAQTAKRRRIPSYLACFLTIGVVALAADIMSVEDGAANQRLSVTDTGKVTITSNDAAGPALRITQQGLGNALSIFDGPTEVVTVVDGGSVGIGTTMPDADALLEVASTTRGFLPPRMTEAQRDGITTPPEGLLVYNTTTSAINLYDGASWQALTMTSAAPPGEQTITQAISSNTLDMFAGSQVRSGIWLQTAASALVGLHLRRITFYLSKSGAPASSQITCKVRDAGDTILAISPNILDIATDVTGVETGYTFTFPDQLLSQGDRILIEYSGGNRLNLHYANSQQYDGANTTLTNYVAGYSSVSTYDDRFVLVHFD